MTSLALTLGPTWYWYFTRGTGVVALLLLTAIMVLGVFGPQRVGTQKFPRFALQTIHRDLSLLAVVLVVLHVATTVFDGFAPIGWADGLIPFLSPYRTFWLGIGTVAFDLMLAVIITSLVRVRIGYKLWRWVHWLAYLSWPLAVAHGLGTGTDAAAAWSVIITFLCVIVLAVAVFIRLLRDNDFNQVWRTPALTLTVAVPVILFLLAVVGPLSPHWAQRSGTPSYLLSHGGK